MLKNRWSTYGSSSYEYNELNKVGTHDIDSSLGLAYKFINKKRTMLILSIGPSLGFVNGGEDCSTDSNCGNIIYGSAIGIDYKKSLVILGEIFFHKLRTDVVKFTQIYQN